MEEKVLIEGKLKNIKVFCTVLALLGLVIYVIDGFYVTNSNYEWRTTVFKSYSDYTMSDSMKYAFGLGNEWNLILIPLVLIFPILAYIIYRRWSRIKMVVTDKRVYGITSTGKRVDLPLDSISAVGTSSLLSGVSVSTASGVIKFSVLKNRDEVYSEISQLLVKRQNNPVVTAQSGAAHTTFQSGADELMKYKSLLDNGVITQEEFDAKKKQLLEL